MAANEFLKRFGDRWEPKKEHWDKEPLKNCSCFAPNIDYLNPKGNKCLKCGLRVVPGKHRYF